MAEPDDKQPGPPGDDEQLAPLPFTVRRAVAKIGRNDPCPCGSGKKYKRCCLEKDQKRLADPSPVAGMTMEEAKRDPARHGDARVLAEMTAEELAAVDRAPLSNALLEKLFDEQLVKGAYPAAAATIDELRARNAVDDAGRDDLLDLLVVQALRTGDRDFAKAQMERRATEETLTSELNRMSLALMQRAPRPMRVLETLARELVDDQQGLADVADALSIAGFVGVGLLVTRAAAAVRESSWQRGVGLTMDDLLVELRKAIGRRDDDPGRRFIVEKPRAQRPEEGAATRRRAASGGEGEAAELRLKLREREATILSLRAERDSLASQLERQALVAGARTRDEGDGDADPDELRRLRRKIDELQAELRRAQQERLELRQQLRDAGAAMSVDERRAAAIAVESGDDLDDEGAAEPPGPEVDAAVFPVEWTEAFHESAAALDDQRLALRAQETAVRFAALDPATWKQAKKMADLRDVFTLRVGIHHRLFVVRRDGRVQARELVPREGFERALKRYRR